MKLVYSIVLGRLNVRTKGKMVFTNSSKPSVFVCFERTERFLLLLAFKGLFETEPEFNRA